MFRRGPTTAFLCLFLVAQCLAALNTNENEMPVNRIKRSNNDNIEFFIRQTLNNFRGTMKTGFPMFGISRMDPLAIDNMFVETKSDRAAIKSSFADLLLFGLSTFDIAQLHVSRIRMRMDITLTFQNLTITGLYDMTGKIAKIFPIYGNGKFEAYATDVIISGSSALVTLLNGSLAIQNLDLDMNFDKAHVHFHHLLGGGALSGAANGIANLFGKRIFEQSKPKLMKKLEQTLAKSLNSKLATVNVFGT